VILPLGCGAPLFAAYCGAMQRLTFASMSGIGPWLHPRDGTVADLLRAIPYFVMGSIPPPVLVNDRLVRGIYDAGMSGGCIWEPFELDAREFDLVVEELRRSDAALEVFDVPDSVRTNQAWFEHQHRRLPDHLREPDGPLDLATARRRWHEQLPVADLYMARLRALDPDWRAKPEDDFPLPAELIAAVRRHAAGIDEWDAERRQGPPSKARMERSQARRVAVRDCVDRLGLPRWPFGG
jgi:hypothetical protein